MCCTCIFIVCEAAVTKTRLQSTNLGYAETVANLRSEFTQATLNNSNNTYRHVSLNIQIHRLFSAFYDICAEFIVLHYLSNVWLNLSCNLYCVKDKDGLRKVCCCYYCCCCCCPCEHGNGQLGSLKGLGHLYQMIGLQLLKVTFP
jgi:hypothetical protein